MAVMDVIHGHAAPAPQESPPGVSRHATRPLTVTGHRPGARARLL